MGAGFAMLRIFVGRTVELEAGVCFDMATADRVCSVLDLLLVGLGVGLYVAVRVEAGRGRRMFLLAVVNRGSELPRIGVVSRKFEI